MHCTVLQGPPQIPQPPQKYKTIYMNRTIRKMVKKTKLCFVLNASASMQLPLDCQYPK